MAVEITTTYAIGSHMLDCETCPDCSVKQKPHIWYEHIIAFMPVIRYGKTAAGVLVFECPACFEHVWFHQDLDHLMCYGKVPNEVKIAAEIEHRNRMATAESDYAKSLCKTCKLRESIEFNCLYPFRTCPVGCGRVEVACLRYEK